MRAASKGAAILITGIILGSCQKPAESVQQDLNVPRDPLPSWNETATKKSIIDFVAAVTKEGGPKFVPVEERIATFDNDGTLWCEQPLYFEVVYSLVATKQIAEKVPTLMKRPAIKALVSGNNAAFMKGGEKALLEAVAISHTAIDVDEFNRSAATWLDTAIHKRFGKKYAELNYKPMLELLQYLRDNGFKTYIVSGGSSMFVRVFSEKTYGIPPEQVIGTTFKGDFVQKDSAFAVVLKPEPLYFDDKAGKPVAIYQFIGRKPIFAFGNSDGDQQMLQWTSTHTRPNLSLILHHTDSLREYAYDRDSQIGRLDLALSEGKQKGWVIVDMQNDWKEIFK